MRFYARKKKSPAFLLTLCLVAVFLAGAAIAAAAAGSQSEEQARQTAEQAIRKAMISCYAIEGSFPQSWEYLQEHYGVSVDDRFVVEYEALGGNIMPQVQVVVRGGSAF